MHLKNHGGIAAMRDAERDYNTSSQTSPVDWTKAQRRGRRFQIVDGGPYYTSYPISYYPHYLILLPTYFMAGLQNNRGRKRRARARPQMTKFGR